MKTALQVPVGSFYFCGRDQLLSMACLCVAFLFFLILKCKREREQEPVNCVCSHECVWEREEGRRLMS